MTERRLARVVPDSTVLFSRVLHDLVGRLAAGHRLFDVIWSDELLAETKRVPVRETPTTEDVAERWVRRVREAFPDGRVDPANVPPEVDLSQLTTDSDDEHVCGLAVAGDADVLLSSDTGFVGDALAARGVEIVDPDSFLLGWPTANRPSSSPRSLTRPRRGVAGSPSANSWTRFVEHRSARSPTRLRS